MKNKSQTHKYWYFGISHAIISLISILVFSFSIDFSFFKKFQTMWNYFFFSFFVNFRFTPDNCYSSNFPIIIMVAYFKPENWGILDPLKKLGLSPWNFFSFDFRPLFCETILIFAGRNLNISPEPIMLIVLVHLIFFLHYVVWLPKML